MAQVDIILKAQNRYQAEFNRLNSEVNKLSGNATQKFGGLTKVVAGGIAAIGGVQLGRAIAGNFSEAVSAAADFEQSLADTAAVMNLTLGEAEPLGKLIDDLAVDPNLKVSAVEAGSAINLLARNGLDMGTILGGAAREVVLLANATDADFGQAADIATDVMAQFNIEAKDMRGAVNGITGVVNNSKFSINDYALAIAQGGGVASTVGVSFEDFNTSIAATSSLFASGSDSGTSFKTFLQRLAPDTKPAREAMEELGLLTEDGGSKFFDASGQMKEMSEIVRLLNAAILPLSDEQRNLALQTIFGTDAMRTAAGLANTTAAEYSALSEKVNDLTDAQKSAATRTDTLKGSFSILKDLISADAKAIGDEFRPELKRLVDLFIEIKSTGDSSLVPFFATVADGFGRIVDFAEEFNRTGRVFNDVLFQIVPGSEQAAAGLESLSQFISDAQVNLQAVSAIVLPEVTAIRERITLAFQNIIPQIEADISTLTGGEFSFEGAFSTIKESLKSGLQLALAAPDFDFSTSFTTLATKISEQIGVAFSGDSTSIADSLAILKTNVSDSFTGLFSGDDFSVTDSITPLRQKIVDDFSTTFGSEDFDFLAAAAPLRLKLSDAIGNTFGEEFDLTESISLLKTKFTDAIGNTFGEDFSLVDSIAVLKTRFTDALSNIFGEDFNLIETVSVLRTKLSDAIGNAFGEDFSLVDAFVSLNGKINDAIAGLISDLDLGESVPDLSGKIAQMISDSITDIDLAQLISDRFALGSDIAQIAIDALAEAFVFGPEIGRNIGEAVGVSLGGIANIITDTLANGELAENIGGTLGAFLSGGLSAAFETIDNDSSIFASIFTFVGNFANGFVDELTGFDFAESFQGIGDSLKSIFENLEPSIQNISNIVTGLTTGNLANLIFGGAGLGGDLLGDFTIPGLDSLTGFAWPEIPEFTWPKLPKWVWTKLPEWVWPTLPSWKWPGLPKFKWPSFPEFKWPALPSIFGQALGGDVRRGGIYRFNELGGQEGVLSRSGSLRFPQGNAAYLNRGETVIPANQLAGAMGGGGGGVTVNIYNPQMQSGANVRQLERQIANAIKRHV